MIASPPATGDGTLVLQQHPPVPFLQGEVPLLDTNARVGRIVALPVQAAIDGEIRWRGIGMGCACGESQGSDKSDADPGRGKK